MAKESLFYKMLIEAYEKQERKEQEKILQKYEETSKKVLTNRGRYATIKEN